MKKGDASKLERFAVDYLTSQIEDKRNAGHWGEVKLLLRFKNGELTTVLVGDEVTVKPIDLERKPAEAG